VQKGEDDKWIEVETPREFKEQYAMYNHVLIGRDLFLSKLEEAAEVRACVEVHGESSAGDVVVEVAQAFDKRINDVTNQWKTFLLEGENQGSAVQAGGDDEAINRMVQKVESALTALKLKSVDLTPKRMKKRWAEEDDEYSSKTTQEF